MITRLSEMEAFFFNSKYVFEYIKLKPVHLAGQQNETYRVFFTWYGTDKLYTIDEEKLADK